MHSERTTKQSLTTKNRIMTNAQKIEAATMTIGFEYFMNCVKNGATPEQAKAEMLTEKAQKTIAKRIKEILA